jgi:ABC-2 type transport system permease protein
VNWEHFKAIAWLRWRLSRNQWKRAGIVNRVIVAVFTVSLFVCAGLSFFLALVLGILLLPKASPLHVTFVWDGIVAVFSFGWVFSMLTAIQRSELPSLDKFLHLPMSLRTAFIMNYLTTFLSFNVICIVPGAIGLSLAFLYLTLTFKVFGMDRHGFRAYVLMPASRRQLLLGKNLGGFQSF